MTQRPQQLENAPDTLQATQNAHTMRLHHTTLTHECLTCLALRLNSGAVHTYVRAVRWTLEVIHED